MKLQKYKKLKLVTLVLSILTILIMISGLILIALSNANHGYLKHFNWYITDSKLIKDMTNGFSLLHYVSISYLLNNSAEHICFINNNNNEWYYDWIQLQVGVIFCIILVPIFGFISLSLTFFIVGLKIKIKNNNFWDAIQNCEIINNYYIH